MASRSSKQPVKSAGLTEAALRQLVAGGLVATLRVKHETDGYVVFADMGSAQAQLLSTRGEPRTFSSLDTAAAAVARLGASEFITQLTTSKKR